MKTTVTTVTSRTQAVLEGHTIEADVVRNGGRLENIYNANVMRRADGVQTAYFSTAGSGTLNVTYLTDDRAETSAAIEEFISEIGKEGGEA